MSYDNFAQSFAQSRKKPWPDINELMEIGKNIFQENLGEVLDVGCGSARLLPELQKNFQLKKYTGVDISGELLKIASSDHPEGNYIQINMKDIGQIGDMFDTIFFIASFHHLLTNEDHKKTLKAVFECLRHGGHIVLLNWNLLSKELSNKYSATGENKNIFPIPFTGNDRFYYGFQLGEIENLLIGAGFSICYNAISTTEKNIVSIAQKI